MSKPRIVLMDEPSMGLSPILVEEIFDIIKSISNNGTTVLLVEQNAKKALEIANRAEHWKQGKSFRWRCQTINEHELAKKAYLGNNRISKP